VDSPLFEEIHLEEF